MPAVGLLLLAAGASSRLSGDGPKQLLPYQGRTLLRHAAETALVSQCRPIMVVLGAQAARLQQELTDLPLMIISADRWEQGMGASLHAGMTALTANTEGLDGVVITLCDQPLLTAEHLDTLINASDMHPNILIASEYSGTLGVPALFPEILFPELRNLPEAQGAKPIIQRYATQAIRIPFPNGAFDIDTISDYRRLLTEQEQERD